MKSEIKDQKASWDFLEYVNPHYNCLIRHCEKLTGNRSDAEDLMQDFLLSMSTREFAARDGEVRPQLFAALRNRHIDNIRRQRSAARNADLVSLDEHDALQASQFGPVHQQPERQLQAQEDLRGALQLIDDLPDSQREAVLAVVIGEDDIRDVAQRTHKSVHTVKSTLARARARLITTSRDRQRTPGMVPLAPAAGRIHAGRSTRTRHDRPVTRRIAK